MPLPDILAKVAADIAAVPGVGPVFQYQPVVQFESDLKAKLLDSTGRLNAVSVSRNALASSWRTLGNGREDRHQLTIRYWYALQDTGDVTTTSETVFEGLIEAVRTALDGDRHLADAAGKRQAIDSGPVQIKTQGFAMLSGALCHYAELSLEAQEYPANP